MAAHHQGRGTCTLGGLEVHAGHGLDYATAEKIAGLPQIVELNIGYYMIGRGAVRGTRRDGTHDARRDGPGRKQPAIPAIPTG